MSGIMTGQFLLKRAKKRRKIVIKLLSIYLLTNIILLTIQWISVDTIIYALLSGQQNLASLEILLPIAVTIGIGPYLSKKSQHSATKTLRWAILVLWILLILDQYGIYIFSLNFSLYGILGVIRSSYYNLEANTKSKLEKPITKTMVILATIFLSYYLHTVDHTHVFTPIIHTLFLYASTVAIVSNTKDIRTQRLQKLGKHSFIIYIGHIVVLKALSYWLGSQQNIVIAILTTAGIIVLSIVYTQEAIQKFIEKSIRRWKR